MTIYDEDFIYRVCCKLRAIASYVGSLADRPTAVSGDECYGIELLIMDLANNIREEGDRKATGKNHGEMTP